MKSTSQTPTIAVIGAGAIADIFHLPALARRADLAARVIVVDRDAARAAATAAKHGIRRHVTDFRSVLGEIQGAIIAVPHHLHFAISKECLAAGVHVLCEKPIAESGDEVGVLVKEATAHGVSISVNNTRRLYPSTRAIRALIEQGALGEIRRIEFEEGGAFEWPAVGDGYFGVNSGGRGVLLDVGAHVLDLICWWLGGAPEVVRYADDAAGGSEAVAEIELRRGACEVYVKLSWLSKLRNRYRIVGSTGAAVEHGIYDWRSPTLIAPNGRRTTIKTEPGPGTYPGFADILVKNFVETSMNQSAPLIPAASVASSVELLHACYSRRTRLPAPWDVAVEGAV